MFTTSPFSLEEVRAENLLRTLTTHDGIDFASNDYLGLADSQEIRKKLIGDLEAGIPLGSTGSRLISGNTEFHLSVEDHLASFIGRESTLIFGSGYLANEGVISTLGRDAIIYSDELNHSSIVRGIRLSRSPHKIFRHNDLEHLKTLIEEDSSHPRRVIVTESLFSMDGDFAPLRDLIRLSEIYGLLLIVDEAHATGVFGKDGGGCLRDLSFDEDRVISIHTGGKALGAHGAFVGCSRLIKEFLVNRCHPFIYSTAIPPLQCLQLQYSTEIVKSTPRLREDLVRKFTLARSLFEKEFDLGNSSSQIIPIIFGDTDKTISFSKKLAEFGFTTVPIRYPTVARGSERIRISIHSNQNVSDIEKLCQHLRDFKEAHVA